MLLLGALLAARAGAAPSPVATFSDVDGNVTVLRGGAEVDGEEDMDLFQGDEVRPDAGGGATITFLDDHFVTLGERTTLTLKVITANPARGTFFGRVVLTTGKLFANFARLTTAGSGFQVATGTAVAAVKGTTFAVEADGGVSTVAVTEGTVATAGLDAQGREQAPVAVGPGQESTVAAMAHPPSPAAPIGARHGWVRARLDGIRAAAEHHRGLRRSGDLHRLRQLRRRAREGTLDTGADPEARAFLAAHPEEREHLSRCGERHRRIQERRGLRQKARQERRDVRQERRRKK